MNILGISALYHDSAAALVIDGRLIAASEEERFSRKKFDASFPTQAAHFCLKQGGISIDQLDYVVFYEKPFTKFERILHNTLGFFPKTARWFTEAVPVWLGEKLWFEHVFYKHIPRPAKKSVIGIETTATTNKKCPGPIFLYSDHHLSHAASSYFCSGFEDSAFLTIDGVGEWSTTTMGVARGNKIEIHRRLEYPHSLGLLYSTFTAFLGFEVNSDEYKVMGLAAYGKPEYLEDMLKIVDVKEDGSFHLDMRYFGFPYSHLSYNQKMIDLFGPPREPESECNERHKNIAASIQRLTEDIILRQAQYLYTMYKIPRICMAGGVALNCVANGRILRETPFKELYIQPAAGDSGGAVGAALLAYHSVLKKDKDYTPHRLESPYVGSGFSDKEIKEWVEKNKVQFQEKKLLVHEYLYYELIEKTANAIAMNKVVGWFQERGEFGPRALGHRSILANPAHPEMQNILNAKIKHREMFRPFAPSVLREKAEEYFDLRGHESPYMLLVADVKVPYNKKLPAITHVDGTARVQTVTKESESRYYELIKAVGERTGYYVVVNTSFNVRGEPIVRTMDEAFHCFMHTDMDVLVVGDFVIEKM